MVLLALRRASLDWLVLEELERLSGQYVCLQQQQQQQRQRGDDDGTADIHSSIRKKRRLKEEHWTIQRDEVQDTIKIINDDESSNNNELLLQTTTQQQQQQLIHTLQTIRTLTTHSLPQLSSRIIHATSPIVHELSRGYFVPFGTVALACLGRIHVLVLRLGRELVGMLSQCVPRLRECVVVDDTGDDTGKGAKRGGDRLIKKKLKEALCPFVSMPKVKEESHPSNNEWNELMKPFTEISQEDFNKKLSNFVKDRRWKDAMVAFGIKEKDWNEMKMSQQLSGGQDDKDEDGNDVGMDIDDMGELVYMQHASENNNEKDDAKRSNADVDDNMARVLNKRRIDEEKSTSTKKKKRRRKKKKSMDDSEVNEDTVDNTIKSLDEGAKIESKESAGNVKETVDEGTKTTSSQSDKGLKSTDALPLQKSSLFESDNSDDEVLLDARKREVEPVTKKEKKSKKKKTKKKKSKNVIDDIFG